MLESGLVSISFRPHSPESVIELATHAGLGGIEWGGDVHVPHGQVKTATRIGKLTREAGMAVAAYGSYYRLGHSDKNGLPFKKVLDTACALETDRIRVWAGTRGSTDADRAYAHLIIDEAYKKAELAKEHGIRLVLEHHGGTLNDTTAAAEPLLTRINHSHLRTYWQPPLGYSHDENLKDLQTRRDYIDGFHVFHWELKDGELIRQPLADATDQWSQYLNSWREVPSRLFALLEFVKDDSPEQFFEDAATLNHLLGIDPAKS